MAQQDDGLFEEDIAPDEEALGWTVSDDQDGIEISIDCTKCQGSTPFVIFWEDLTKLGKDQKVKGFVKAGAGFTYRHTCPTCLQNYTSAGYADGDAHKEATSAIMIGVGEFDAWHRQALGRLRGSQRQQKAQQYVAQQAAQQQPSSAPVRARPQLTLQQTEAVKRYSRDLQAQGYGAQRIQQMRKAFLTKLLKQAVQRPAPTQLPPGCKYMRRRADGHRVVVGPSGNVVKDLGPAS